MIWEAAFAVSEIPCASSRNVQDMKYLAMTSHWTTAGPLLVLNNSHLLIRIFTTDIWNSLFSILTSMCLQCSCSCVVFLHAGYITTNLWVLYVGHPASLHQCLAPPWSLCSTLTTTQSPPHSHSPCTHTQCLYPPLLITQGSRRPSRMAGQLITWCSSSTLTSANVHVN